MHKSNENFKSCCDFSQSPGATSRLASLLNFPSFIMTDRTERKSIKSALEIVLILPTSDFTYDTSLADPHNNKYSYLSCTIIQRVNYCKIQKNYVFRTDIKRFSFAIKFMSSTRAKINVVFREFFSFSLCELF